MAQSLLHGASLLFPCQVYSRLTALKTRKNLARSSSLEKPATFHKVELFLNFEHDVVAVPPVHVPSVDTKVARKHRVETPRPPTRPGKHTQSQCTNLTHSSSSTSASCSTHTIFCVVQPGNSRGSVNDMGFAMATTQKKKGAKIMPLCSFKRRNTAQQNQLAVQFTDFILGPFMMIRSARKRHWLTNILQTSALGNWESCFRI